MEPPLDLRQLRYFEVLATEQHFGRAAGVLGMAQPSLSEQIARLEARVGHPLLVRRPRFALTPAGEQLLASARVMLAEAAQGLESARRAGRGESGRLRLGFGASLMLTRLSAAVRGYQERFPGVRLQLAEVVRSAQGEALLAGRIDVGIAREPSMPPGVLTETLRRERFVVALPSRHHLLRRRRISMGELRDETLVLFPRSSLPGTHDQLIALCRAAGFDPAIAQTSPESLTLLALVDAGQGVSIVPESFRRLRFGGVRYRPLEGEAPSTSIALSWRAGESAPAVEFFRTLARETIGSR